MRRNKRSLHLFRIPKLITLETDTKEKAVGTPLVPNRQCLHRTERVDFDEQRGLFIVVE